jgi:hypothetical protein
MNQRGLAPNILLYLHTFYVGSIKYTCWEIKLKNLKRMQNPGLLGCDAMLLGDS